MKVGISLGAMVLGLLILFVSLVRTGWEMTRLDLGGEGLKTEPIYFEIRQPDGGIIKDYYKIPDSKVLPDDPTYGLKRWRDWLWYYLAGNSESRARTALLIADKRMGEMMKTGKLEVAREAVAWLVLASQYPPIGGQVYKASLAYQQEVERIGKKSEKDGVKYLELSKKLKEISDENKEGN